MLKWFSVTFLWLSSPDNVKVSGETRIAETSCKAYAFRPMFSGPCFDCWIFYVLQKDFLKSLIPCFQCPIPIKIYWNLNCLTKIQLQLFFWVLCAVQNYIFTIALALAILSVCWNSCCCFCSGTMYQIHICILKNLLKLVILSVFFFCSFFHISPLIQILAFITEIENISSSMADL